MKKIFVGLVSLFVGLFTLASCNNSTENGGNESKFDTSKNITVYTRDTKSGTRDGFFTAIGHSEAKSNDKLLADGAVTVANNGAMMSAVAGDEYGIGYASLSSVAESDDVKGLTFNGVEATEDSVIDGTYKLSRNFNYITRVDDGSNEAKMTYAFVKYMFSLEGLTIVAANDGIVDQAVLDSAQTWNDIKANDEKVKEALAITTDVTLKFGGSTSVEKIAKALSAAFKEAIKDDVNFIPSHNHTGSGDAYKCTQGSEKDGANKLNIGFLSRDFESGEDASEETKGTICKDGIVAIVSPENDVLEDADSEILWNIFSGEYKTWEDVKKAVEA